MGESMVGDTRKQDHSNSSYYDVSYAPDGPQNVAFPKVIELAKAREQAAISLLYRRFLPVIYRYVLARVADIPTAEDLTSETFFAMVRGIAATRAQDELAFVAWLLGIARYQVLMHYRRVKKQNEVELPPHFEDDLHNIAEDGDPLLILTARESWAETAQALEQLTPDQKTVVLYRCVLGYPTEEVAAMMNKRPGTVRALQFRALAALAKNLKTDTGAATPLRRGPHAL